MNKELFDMLKDSSYKKEKNATLNYSLKKNESLKKRRAKKILILKASIVIATTIGSISIFSSMLANKFTEINNNSDINITDVFDEHENDNSLYEEESSNFDDMISVETIEEKTNEKNIDGNNIYEKKYESNKNDFYVEEVDEENKLFDVGNGYDEDIEKYYDDFIGSDADMFLQKYSKIYGVDYNLMVAIGMQESKLGNYLNNGSAIGFMQIEDTNRDGHDIVYNYEKCCDEEIDYGYLSVLEHNIQVSCMMMQDNINKSNGNIYMAIQGYNFGVTKMSQIANYTAKINHCDADELKEDYANIEWIDNIVPCVGENYGDPNYLKSVLKYCKKNEVCYIYDDKEYIFNLSSGEYSYEEIEKNKKI